MSEQTELKEEVKEYVVEKGVTAEEQYVVEKGVPIPKVTKYPFGRMDVTDSFKFAIEDTSKIRAAMRKYVREYGQTKFSIHGNRCWRIA